MYDPRMRDPPPMKPGLFLYGDSIFTSNSPPSDPAHFTLPPWLPPVGTSFINLPTNHQESLASSPPSASGSSPPSTHDIGIESSCSSDTHTQLPPEQQWLRTSTYYPGTLLSSRMFETWRKFISMCCRHPPGSSNPSPSTEDTHNTQRVKEVIWSKYGLANTSNKLKLMKFQFYGGSGDFEEFVGLKLPYSPKDPSLKASHIFVGMKEIERIIKEYNECNKKKKGTHSLMVGKESSSVVGSMKVNSSGGCANEDYPVVVDDSLTCGSSSAVCVDTTDEDSSLIDDPQGEVEEVCGDERDDSAFSASPSSSLFAGASSSFPSASSYSLVETLSDQDVLDRPPPSFFEAKRRMLSLPFPGEDFISRTHSPNNDYSAQSSPGAYREIRTHRADNTYVTQDPPSLRSSTISQPPPTIAYYEPHIATPHNSTPKNATPHNIAPHIGTLHIGTPHPRTPPKKQPQRPPPKEFFNLEGIPHLYGSLATSVGNPSPTGLRRSIIQQAYRALTGRQNFVRVEKVKKSHFLWSNAQGLTGGQRRAVAHLGKLKVIPPFTIIGPPYGGILRPEQEELELEERRDFEGPHQMFLRKVYSFVVAEGRNDARWDAVFDFNRQLLAEGERRVGGTQDIRSFRGFGEGRGGCELEFDRSLQEENVRAKATPQSKEDGVMFETSDDESEEVETGDEAKGDFSIPFERVNLDALDVKSELAMVNDGQPYFKRNITAFFVWCAGLPLMFYMTIASVREGEEFFLSYGSRYWENYSASAHRERQIMDSVLALKGLMKQKEDFKNTQLDTERKILSLQNIVKKLRSHEGVSNDEEDAYKSSEGNKKAEQLASILREAQSELNFAIDESAALQQTVEESLKVQSADVVCEAINQQLNELRAKMLESEESNSTLEGRITSLSSAILNIRKTSEEFAMGINKIKDRHKAEENRDLVISRENTLIVRYCPYSRVLNALPSGNGLATHEEGMYPFIHYKNCKAKILLETSGEAKNYIAICRHCYLPYAIGPNEADKHAIFCPEKGFELDDSNPVDRGFQTIRQKVDSILVAFESGVTIMPWLKKSYALTLQLLHNTSCDHPPRLNEIVDFLEQQIYLAANIKNYWDSKKFLRNFCEVLLKCYDGARQRVDIGEQSVLEFLFAVLSVKKFLLDYEPSSSSCPQVEDSTNFNKNEAYSEGSTATMKEENSSAEAKLEAWQLTETRHFPTDLVAMQMPRRELDENLNEEVTSFDPENRWYFTIDNSVLLLVEDIFSHRDLRSALSIVSQNYELTEDALSSIPQLKLLANSLLGLENRKLSISQTDSPPFLDSEAHTHANRLSSQSIIQEASSGHVSAHTSSSCEFRYFNDGAGRTPSTPLDESTKWLLTYNEEGGGRKELLLNSSYDKTDINFHVLNEGIFFPLSGLPVGEAQVSLETLSSWTVDLVGMFSFFLAHTRKRKRVEVSQHAFFPIVNFSGSSGVLHFGVLRRTINRFEQKYECVLRYPPSCRKAITFGVLPDVGSSFNSLRLVLVASARSAHSLELKVYLNVRRWSSQPLKMNRSELKAIEYFGSQRSAQSTHSDVRLISLRVFEGSVTRIEELPPLPEDMKDFEQRVTSH